MARRYRTNEHGKRRLVVVDPETGLDGYYEQETHHCSGCTDYGDYGTVYGPFGCRECGFTGKRRTRHWIPFDLYAWLDKKQEYRAEDAVILVRIHDTMETHRG